MSDNVDNRPIEEIKARLDFCRNVKTSGDCMSCPYVEDADVCASDFMFDAFDYMQLLEVEREHYKQVCNALLSNILVICDTCKFKHQPYGEDPCPSAHIYNKLRICPGWLYGGSEEDLYGAE